MMKSILNHRVLSFTMMGWCAMAAAQCKTSSSDSKEIFRDDFNRTNGAVGANYTVNTPGGASFNINSLRVSAQSAGTVFSAMPSAIYTQKVSGAHKISASFQISGGTYVGGAYILGRSTASDVGSNSYACGYKWDDTLATPAQRFVFAKISSGTVTAMGDVALHTLATGISDTVTLTFDGSTLKCEMSGSNNNMAITVKDASYGDGYAGLAGGDSTGNYLYFDSLLIEKL